MIEKLVNLLLKTFPKSKPARIYQAVRELVVVGRNIGREKELTKTEGIRLHDAVNHLADIVGGK